MPPILHVYPPAPGARRSTAFEASVGGRPLFVEAFADVSYLRFAFEGRVRLRIGVRGPIGDWRVLPEQAIAGGGTNAKGDLVLDLSEPSSFVVWVGEREKLFVLADAPAPEPAADGDAVVAVAAVADGVRTAHLQAAIDRVAARPGGGTVLLLPGRHRTGTLRLPSRVTLHVAAGALLEGVEDPAAYPVDPGRHETGPDASLAPDRRFHGRTMTFSRLLLVDDAEGVRIRGHGTISGSGSALRKRHGAVPNLIRVQGSRDVAIEDVLLRDAAAWTVHLLASSDVALANVRVLNDRDNLNTDGIDPDMCSGVRIDRAFVYTKDDAVCVKASRNGELSGGVRDVRVTGSVLSARDAALKIGSETDATRIEDVVFEDCWVFESGRAMSVVVRDGATVERVAFRRIVVDRGVDHLVEQVIGVREPEERLGVIRDLAFEHVTAPAYVVPPSAWTWYAQFRRSRPGEGSEVPVFEGADERHPVDGLRLRNVVVRGQRLASADAARDVAGITIGDHVRNVDIG